MTMNVFEMPIVRPIPIPTVGLPWYKKISAFFSIRKWLVVEPCYLYCDFIKATIFIPSPFVFNFASIPRPLWPLMSPVDLLLLGSIPHDFGYNYGGLILLKDGDLVFVKMSRNYLDRILREITIQYNEMAPIANTAWGVLKAFGWFAWWQNRIENRNVYLDYPGLFV